MVSVWLPVTIAGVSIGPYEVNSDGNVRRVPSSWYGHAHTKFYSSRLKKDGYCYVMLKGKDYAVHRLVLEAFIGEKPQGLVCKHKNRAKWDNRVENLFYGPRGGGRKAKNNGM